MRVTVFGGSAPEPGSEAYEEACTLGRLLGEAGHTALTGGYIGTMEAVSRGCAEAGGHVIGVTCDQIEVWRPVEPNEWMHEERRYPTIHQRLITLIEECDAALALPGGVGTLAEIAMMWNLMQTEALPARPLILIGEGWQEAISTLVNRFGSYIPAQFQSYIQFAPDVETGFSLLGEV